MHTQSYFLIEDITTGLRKGENGVAWGLWVGKNRVWNWKKYQIDGDFQNKK